MAVVEDVTVRWYVGRDCAAAVVAGAIVVSEEVVSEGEGLDGTSSCGASNCSGDTVRGAGVGEGATNGLTNGSCSCFVSGSGVCATLSRLAGRANGLLGRSTPNCDGRLTNGDCLSGTSIGDAGFEGDWKVFVGEDIGLAARTVDGDEGAGDSGRLKGDVLGEKDILTQIACVDKLYKGHARVSKVECRYRMCVQCASCFRIRGCYDHSAQRRM